MAAQKIKGRSFMTESSQDDPVDNYRYAVQPQIVDDGLAADGRPVRRKKKSKLLRKEDIENLKQELDIIEHKCSLDDLAERLAVNFELGISADRAKYTLERDGPNELSPPRTVPEWVKFCKHLFGGFSILLWTASALAFIVYSAEAATLEEPPADNLYIGFVLSGIVVMSGCFSYYQEAQSSRVLETFKSLVPTWVEVTRKGERFHIHAEELVVGDIIDVRGGERVPADIRIIAVLSAQGFKVDNSALTGESEPQIRSAELTSENPLETRNLAFFNTTAYEGSVRGVVIATGDRTLMGRIAAIAARMEVGEETLIAQEIYHLVRIVTCVAVFISLLFFFISLIMGFLWQDALMYLIGLIVACVPEGLLPTITMCMTFSARRMASKNCLIKNLESVETLGSTAIICTDKTGVLTQNKMTVSHLFFDDDVHDAIAEDPSESKFNRDSPTWMTLAKAIMLVFNKAEFKGGQQAVDPLKRPVEADSDPTDVAMLRFVEHALGNSAEVKARNKSVCEIPFSSHYKYKLSIHEVDDPRDQRYWLIMAGAPERIVERCSTILINGEERSIKNNKEFKKKFLDVYRELGAKAERIIGICDKRLSLDKFPIDYKFDPNTENFPQRELRFLGLVSLVDPPRASVPEAVAKCRTAGIKTILVTGDHPLTAKAFAKAIGLIADGSETVDDIAARLSIPVGEVGPRDATAAVIHGSDLSDMTPEQLDNVLYYHNDIVFARTTPYQKLVIVDACQRQGKVVACTGDGIHDTPALKKADLGIAMGHGGTEASKQAADIILLDDSFASIVAGIEEGRLMFDNLKKSIVYTLCSNVPEMCAFIMFTVMQIPLPLGTLTIFFIDLGTDLIPAISLSCEEAEFDVMKRMPRDPKHDKLVNRRMLSLIYGQIGLIQIVGAFWTYFCILAELGFWPARLLETGGEAFWWCKGVNDLEDAFGQEWSYAQRRVAMYSAQSGFFFAIVMMQWSTLIVCKTRRNSVLTQLMTNATLNWSLFIATWLAIFFTNCPGLDKGLRMYQLRWSWWFLPTHFAILIFFYDELRKLFIRIFPGGFLEQETYY